MGASDPPNDPEKQVVEVNEDGQVTIPKSLREAVGIDAPGRVCFRETADGQVVVEGVRSAGEMRGFAAENEASTDERATDILRAKRGDGSIEPSDLTTSGWRLSEWTTGRSQEEIGAHRELLEKADEVDRTSRTVERDE